MWPVQVGGVLPPFSGSYLCPVSPSFTSMVSTLHFLLHPLSTVALATLCCLGVWDYMSSFCIAPLLAQVHAHMYAALFCCMCPWYRILHPTLLQHCKQPFLLAWSEFEVVQWVFAALSSGSGPSSWFFFFLPHLLVHRHFVLHFPVFFSCR